ncbi:MAG: hypothetical protein AB7S38_00715 [Vulcanimicrobiota bacterium]
MLIVQIDGLSADHLDRAINQGLMPNLHQRLKQGALELSEYRCGLPSQTSVVVGGFLYGEMLPGNQYYDKAAGQIRDGSSLTKAHEVDGELAARNQGLLEHGSVYVSPLSGGAPSEKAYFTLSDMAAHQAKGDGLKETAREALHLGKFLLAHPAHAAQTAVHISRRIWSEWRLRDQTHRPLGTIVKDAVKEAFASDAAVHAMAAEMKRGEPVMYVDLAHFDGLSHPHGPGPIAFDSLKYVDRDLKVLFEGMDRAERPYQMALLADHGQVFAYHFDDLYGQSIQELTEKLSGQTVLSLDFGSGANLYFTALPGLLERDQLPAGVVASLKQHQGVALVVTRAGQATLIEGKEGSVKVDAEGVKIQGEDPLARFGPTELLARQLHRQAHRPNGGDIIVYGENYRDGQIDFSTGDFRGLHGGIGLGQDRPFLAFTPGMNLDPASLEGADDLYRQLKTHLPADARK